jgi:hypothetical protein
MPTINSPDYITTLLLILRKIMKTTSIKKFTTVLMDRLKIT